MISPSHKSRNGIIRPLKFQDFGLQNSMGRIVSSVKGSLHIVKCMIVVKWKGYASRGYACNKSESCPLCCFEL